MGKLGLPNKIPLVSVLVLLFSVLPIIVVCQLWHSMVSYDVPTMSTWHAAITVQMAYPAQTPVQGAIPSLKVYLSQSGHILWPAKPFFLLANNDTTRQYLSVVKKASGQLSRCWGTIYPDANRVPKEWAVTWLDKSEIIFYTCKYIYIHLTVYLLYIYVYRVIMWLPSNQSTLPSVLWSY